MERNLVINFVAFHGGGVLYSYEMTKAMCMDGRCNIYAIVSSKMENIENWRLIPRLHLIEIKGYSNRLNFVLNLLYFYAVEFIRIKRLFTGINIAAVYIPFVSFWTNHIQRLFKKTRTFYTMHDVYPHNNKKNLVWKISDKLAMKCDHIIILSDYFRNDIKINYHKLDSNILTVPHGNYYNGVNKKGATSTYDDTLYNFIYFGQIQEYKGLDVLADAFRLLFKERKDVSLTIAGSGDFSPYRDKFAAAKCPNLRIINRWITDEEIPELFSAKKQITVLPYKSASQSGVIPLSMHLQSLVIATNCSGISEQVINGKTGFLVEPNNVESLLSVMLFVISNWGEMEKIVEQAYQHIESMDWGAISCAVIDHI
ncbi:MAG: glycosyltransferase family 4 protein [Candidatus Izemoplasmatales bacterium]